MTTFRIKKGDTAVIISGKDAGREGKVLRVYPKAEHILVEGINMRKRHRRPRRAGEKGSVVEVATPFSWSRAMPKCPNCARATRIGIKITGQATRSRACKKCGTEF
ncbi:MAG: 50S ribosomal protein L24 [Candidatus Giovannonibacteria bacterium GW2011_GWA2_53_7]|uniref:Large ribosomal subunit protein uL24 n=1 Tax=Candidatus Giovannonibacteria bacterium GW2011_GWA2_53_7 TaxID=1618650 RepID=A0A0G1Y0D5_9BACT|nr:MAG: 50S ribosomal protein L24 [Candidatus Giovannonibacteria bacterium GW2011_GWA2_53_7]